MTKYEGEGYEAGESFEGSLDIPEYVQTIRDELNVVREARTELYQKHFGDQPLGYYRPPDPIREIQYQQACEALDKEEERLMGSLKDAEWLIPPAFEPPHNLSAAKAKEILSHGEVHGRPLTERQRGLFGVIASGKKPRKMM